MPLALHTRCPHTAKILAPPMVQWDCPSTPGEGRRGERIRRGSKTRNKGREMGEDRRRREGIKG